MRKPRGFEEKLCYGGDYNPEQWSESVWAEDMALMRRAGVNLVSLGVFAWSRIEPTEGEYDFDWLDRVLDLLAANGIAAALATPTASPPPWFSLAYPDALPVTRDGVRLAHGSRDTYCVSAPAYRTAARRVAEELGKRYAGHPALAMWHIHNEYGTWCYCDHVAAAFRAWLQDRHGELDRLNEAWTTSFWSQHYSDWSQVLPPRATQYLPNPAQELDFRRFLSDEMRQCFREQRDAVRTQTPEAVVTTNFVLGAWVPVDHWRWADEVDLVAIDHYPSDADGLSAEAETAFAADLARGWAHGDEWLLLEQAPNLIYSGGRMLPKAPGRMARLSLSHVARGSGGSMFFQWRAPIGGAERFHSAMVPHAGPESRVYEEVVALGASLQKLGTVEGRVAAPAALVWDTESWWALQGAGLPAPDLDYWAAGRSVHGALWRAGVTTDVVEPGSDLSSYRLVVVPALYLTSTDAAATMTSYVEGGGTLAVWYLSGTADTAGRIHLGGYAGALHDVLGVRVEELHPQPLDVELQLSNGWTARQWGELVQLTGAERVAAYASGLLTGRPAITRNSFGEGHAWYISTKLDDDALDHLVAKLLADVDIATPSGAGGGVDVVRRGSSTFVINHTSSFASVAVYGTDLLTGAQVTGTLRLGPGAAAVIADNPTPGQ